MESTIVERAPGSGSAMRWSPATRVAFRFFFSYFFLTFILAWAISFVPFRGYLLVKYAELWYAIVVWLERHLLHTGYEVYQLDGSAGISNTFYGTVVCCCCLAIAAVATAVWSALDRRRLQYARLHQIFRYLLRFVLATIMIHYGVLKIIPVQMTSPPPFGALTQPLGDLTRMRLLWLFTGASPAYETLVGCAELLGAVLLLLPRTTLLGGVICAGNLSMVVVLNFCYDVHVKLIALHLLVMALLLVAPDVPRLADVFLFNRGTEPARTPPLFSNRWLDRAPHLFLLAFGLYSVVTGFQESWARYQKFHPPRPPLYGIWNVEELVVDGRELPADRSDRWRRLIFQIPGTLSADLWTGTRERYTLGLDMKGRSMILGGPKTARFSFAKPGEDEMILEGVLDGHPARVKLRKMALISKPFHWIFEAPKEDR
jgi:hypothetical protein